MFPDKSLTTKISHWKEHQITKIVTKVSKTAHTLVSEACISTDLVIIISKEGNNANVFPTL